MNRLNSHKYIPIASVLFTMSSLFYAPSVCSELIIKSPDKQERFSIENKKINESSGLACSTRDEHLLWTHNDTGHMPIIYALNDKGEDRGTFYLDDIESIDWEDMDAFQYQGEHYLLIADTGDNFGILWQHRISIIKEPEVEKGSNKERTSRAAISPQWSLVFKYEDGKSYDVESAAVDIVREKIILLTKRNKPTLMFELPLKAENNDDIQIAVKTASFPEIINPSALDISADGKLMSINTYRRIHRFHRKSPDEQWQYQYSLKYENLFQPEAMCLSVNNKNYYVSTEKKPILLKISNKLP